MSVFTKVVEEHADATRRKAELEALKAREASDADTNFLRDFKNALHTIARPILELTTLEANEHGFPARLETKDLDDGGRRLSLHLIPEVGATFSVRSSEEAVFSIRSLLSTRQVSYDLYFDQRPAAKGGKINSTYGVQSLNKDTIERLLEDFLKRAIGARDPE